MRKKNYNLVIKQVVAMCLRVIRVKLCRAKKHLRAKFPRG